MNGKQYKFEHVGESPSDYEVNEGVVYVCDLDKVFQLKCPCGCGDTIKGQLYPLESPSWKVQGNSLSPSIDRTVGCKSHFTITNGVVKNNA